jgi:hypothetical protein
MRVASKRLFSMLVLASATALACASPALAVVDASKTYPALIVAAPPPLQADFSVPPWTQATPLEGFETLTTRTAASANPTVARIVFDAQNVYVAIHSVQTTPLVATQTTNNVGFGIDDYVGIGIDTSGNGQVYYFEVTPGGVRYQQATESARYNPQWNAVVRPLEGGWDALLVVPLNVLRTQGGAEQRWRFNIVRHIAASNENETLAYDPLMTDSPNNGGFPQTSDARFWPYLAGIKIAGRTVRPKPRAELFALGSAGRDKTLYQQATGAYAPQGARNVGLDVNLPLTGTIAYVGAFAPDFSNVEIDQQTIAPQEFRRNLQEYRPFFAQGANFFAPAFSIGINSAPNILFYSPGIGPFTQGHKLEGSFGLQSFGLLSVAGAGFDDTVFGYKHALPDRSFGYAFDAISAHHADGNATAYTAAASDVTWDATVSGRNGHTGFVYGLDYGSERGVVPGTTPRLAYKSEDFIDVHKQNYEVLLSYKDIGPKWNPVDGFTNLADIRGPQFFVDLNGNPPASSPFKRVDLFLSADRFVDRSGAAHQSDASAFLDVVFRNQLHLSGGPSFSSLRLYDHGLSAVGYDLGYANGISVPFNGHNFSIGYKDGTPTPIDFTTFWGPFTTFNPDGTIRPTYLRGYQTTTSRPIGKRLTLGLEYDGTFELFPTSNPKIAAYDGQILRRVSVVESLGNESSFSLSLRSINGNGGFAAPGINLAAAFHRRFKNDSELFVNYGTPAANSTLQRVILKYLMRVGSGAGT